MSIIQNNKERINVYCLPFAGGSCYAYRDFERYLPDFINLIMLDLPGHGKRMTEPLLSNLHDMADDVFAQIQHQLHQPYAIYGHSMGATLAYLTTRKIMHEKLPQPLHLFVTGRQGPSIDSKEKNAYLLPKEEFILRLKEYRGIPQEILAETELLDFFEPIIRADFKAIGTFSYHSQAETPNRNGSPPLNIPITVIIGLNDTTSYSEALTWQNETSQKIVIRQLPGGHFFIFDHTPEICHIISRALWETNTIQQ